MPPITSMSSSTTPRFPGHHENGPSRRQRDRPPGQLSRPVALTSLLTGQLDQSQQLRVVNVASATHVSATLDLDDLDFRRGYTAVERTPGRSSPWLPTPAGSPSIFLVRASKRCRCTPGSSPPGCSTLCSRSAGPTRAGGAGDQRRRRAGRRQPVVLRPDEPGGPESAGPGVRAPAAAGAAHARAAGPGRDHIRLTQPAGRSRPPIIGGNDRRPARHPRATLRKLIDDSVSIA